MVVYYNFENEPQGLHKLSLPMKYDSNNRFETLCYDISLMKSLINLDTSETNTVEVEPQFATLQLGWFKPLVQAKQGRAKVSQKLW